MTGELRAVVDPQAARLGTIDGQSAEHLDDLIGAEVGLGSIASASRGSESAIAGVVTSKRSYWCSRDTLGYGVACYSRLVALLLGQPDHEPTNRCEGDQTDR